MTEYERDYQKSLKIIRGFINEILEGDIEKMRTFCFDDLRDSKYIGIIADPDMFLITQAIYIILWGDIYDLTFENMGVWNTRNAHPFRGDTMNGFGSLIGKIDFSLSLISKTVNQHCFLRHP